MKSLILIFAVISVTRAVIFNCTFTMRTPTAQSDRYTCYHPTLSYIGDNESLTAAYGSHMSGKTNNHVGYLEIDQVSSLKYFPKRINNFFPNLYAIQISNCNITMLQDNELDAFRSLNWLKLSGHPHLERIPGSLFANTPNLQYLFLESNNIKYVAEGSFGAISKLTYAYFMYNFCVNIGVSSNSQMPLVIKQLREYCVDIETTTTSATTSTLTSTTRGNNTTTTSTEKQSCGDICNLEEQNKFLMQQNEEIKINMDAMTVQNVELTIKVQELATKNTELDTKIDDLRKKMKEVLEGILELATRP